MAAIVQRLERLIVVQDVEGSNPSSRPISNFFSHDTFERLAFFGLVFFFSVFDQNEYGAEVIALKAFTNFAMSSGVL